MSNSELDGLCCLGFQFNQESGAYEPCMARAVAKWNGQPVCEQHKELCEEKEWLDLARSICAGLNLETLRWIQSCGGLVPIIAQYRMGLERRQR